MQNAEDSLISGRRSIQYVISQVAVIGSALTIALIVVEDFSALPGCYAASVPNIIAGFWITPLLVESR